MRFSQVDTAAAVAANDSGSVAGLRDAALLAVASDGLLRVSEVAALDVGDVQAEADGSGRLLVGESKTDQEGQGAVLYLGALTVSRVSAWLAAAGHQDGPLFRRVRRGGRVEGDPGRRLSVKPSAKSSATGRPLSASRAGYPVTASELAARNRWQPAGPRLSRCRRRAGGSRRRCRATMHGASWLHGAPSLASATVADNAGVDGSPAASGHPSGGVDRAGAPRTAPAHLRMCSKITTARTPVNRSVGSFLWLPRMADPFGTSGTGLEQVWNRCVTTQVCVPQ